MKSTTLLINPFITAIAPSIAPSIPPLSSSSSACGTSATFVGSVLLGSFFVSFFLPDIILTILERVCFIKLVSL